jgi:hypothetical protein
VKKLWSKLLHALAVPHLNSAGEAVLVLGEALSAEELDTRVVAVGGTAADLDRSSRGALELDQDVGSVDGVKCVAALQLQDLLVYVAGASGVDFDKLVLAA